MTESQPQWQIVKGREVVQLKSLTCYLGPVQCAFATVTDTKSPCTGCRYTLYLDRDGYAQHLANKLMGDTQ